MRSAVAVICTLAGTAPAMAQNIPPGNYLISGTVTSVSGDFCPAPLKQVVAGVLHYPTSNPRDGTEMAMQITTPGKMVTQVWMNAFGPVPATGLNGWTAASPATPNYFAYQNGKPVAGGTPALLSFNVGLAGYPELSAVQGTMTMVVDSIGPCTETFLLTFQRGAPFPGLTRGD